MFILLFIISFLCCSAVAEQHSQEVYEMNWLGENSMFSVRYHNNKTTFAVVFRNKIPDYISTKFHYLFDKKELNNETTFTYYYDESFEIPYFSNPEEFDILEQTYYDHRYHVHKPLIQNDCKTHNISVKEARKILQQKSIAWYTGAGISASVVPTMATLEASLGIIGTSREEEFCNLITNILQNPEHIITTMHAFYTSCFQGNPTQAHRAISKYEKQKKCLVFTENLDMLHESSGTIPIRIEDPIMFKQNITAEKLQNIDIIVCVGLSHDDRGLLAYYKYCNPQGIIIALCLDKPVYLGKTDYFLQGDAQKIISKLVK